MFKVLEKSWHKNLNLAGWNSDNLKLSVVSEFSNRRKNLCSN